MTGSFVAPSPLAEALDHADDYGFTVVSMKQDWKTVFGRG